MQIVGKLPPNISFKGINHQKEVISSDVLDQELMNQGLEKGSVLKEYGPREDTFWPKMSFDMIGSSIYLDLVCRKKDLQEAGVTNPQEIVDNVEPFDPKTGSIKEEYVNKPVNLPNTLPAVFSNPSGCGENINFGPVCGSSKETPISELIHKAGCGGRSGHIPEDDDSGSTATINPDGSITQTIVKYHVPKAYDGKIVTEETETRTFTKEEIDNPSGDDMYFERVKDNRYNYLVKMIAADMELHQLLTELKD